ncbi:MAG: sulfotransferase [Bacteroidota bacterium]
MSNRFIVGMSRAGTTWIGKCLNEHPDSMVFGESLFWGRGYIEPEQEDGSYTLPQLKKVLKSLEENSCAAFLGCQPGNLRKISKEKVSSICGELEKELSAKPTPSEVFLKFSSKLLAIENKAIAIEKTPHHIHWLSRILTALPNSRFIVMVRNPYEFMLSYKHQGDRQPLILRKKFEKLYHPIVCAYLWRGYFRSSIKAVKTYPKQTLLVFTHEMKQNPSDTLLKVQDFLSLTPIADLAIRVPPDNSSFPNGQRPSLNSIDLFWINCIAFKEISEFKFITQRSDAKPLEILKSILGLPIWSVWASWHLYRSTQGSPVKYLLHWFNQFIGTPHNNEKARG